MKHIVFVPLKEEYEDVSIRSSELNSYLNPSPYEFTNTDSRAECMSIGDYIHEISQYTMLMWEDKWHECADKHIAEVSANWPYERAKEYEWFLWAAHQYVELVKHLRCSYIEQKRTTIIEYSWYKVTFSWTSDCDIDMYTMYDIKSAWSKWSEDKAKSERQKYYYAWLKNVRQWTENDTNFKYVILTKQKKPQIQEFDFVIPFKEAEKYVKADLKVYLTWLFLSNK